MTATLAPTAPADSRTPPGPRGLPLLGVVPDIARHRGLLVAVLHFWHIYGDVVQARLGLTRAIFFARPTAVQRILVDNRDNYVRSKEAIRSVSGLLGDGLITSEGAHWRRERHFMQGKSQPRLSSMPHRASRFSSAGEAIAWSIPS
jgi:cytochrome P450